MKKYDSNGWFQFLYLGIVFVVALLLIFIKTNVSYATPALEFYIGLLPIALLVIIAGIVIKSASSRYTDDGLALPIGQSDEGFILQNLFGWKKALIISLLFGLFLGLFFYNTVLNTGSSIFPTYGMSIYAFSIDSQAIDTRTAFAIGSGVIKGAVDALAATFVENPILLLLPLTILWLGIRYLLQSILPFTRLQILGSTLANWIAVFIASISTANIFPYIYHYAAYQGITPAYNYNQFFVTVALLGTVLTGFPMPLDFAHFGNNFAVSTRNLFSIAVTGVVYGAFLVPVISEKYLNKKRKIKEIKN